MDTELKENGFILSDEDINKLKDKVTREFNQADQHVSSWKEDVRNVGRDYLLADAQTDRVKIRKVLNNLTIRLATFLSDEIQVTNVPMNWALWVDNATNADKVFEANFDSMNIRNKYREAIIDDSLTWVWVLAVDWRNDHSQEPIVSYIDSRLTYPDPKNWQDNNLRFFWTKVRKNLYELEADEAYDNSVLQKIKFYEDEDISRKDRNDDDMKDFNYSEKWEDQVDIYNHITVFKGEKDDIAHVYLSSWGLNWQELVRVIKLRPLTPDEMEDASKIDFWVKFFRAKPLKWSYAWVSLIDDVGQYQDIETLLTNLQIEQAKEAAMWGRTYLDSRLWIDADDVANNTGAWSVIPFATTDPNVNASNWVFLEPTRPQNPIVWNTINLMGNNAQLADPSWNALTQWVWQAWSQTKAEVQTLQQNINQVLSYMASNYMEALKWLWESIYRSYAANMSPQRKKDIVVVDYKWVPDAYSFKKKEFISDWSFFIVVKSKAQEEIKKKQDFAVLLSVVWTLKTSVKPGSTQDVIIDRLLIEKSGIKWLDPLMIHALTRDERIAYWNLELLNNDIELETKPEPGEDHTVYINIYKTWLDTKARNKAIMQREVILEAEPNTPAPLEEEATWGWWVAQQLWASLIAQETSQWEIPSIQNI